MRYNNGGLCQAPMDLTETASYKGDTPYPDVSGEASGLE
jgi:hypothetical protein